MIDQLQVKLKVIQKLTLSGHIYLAFEKIGEGWLAGLILPGLRMIRAN